MDRKPGVIQALILIAGLFFTFCSHAETIELSGSPYATAGTPLPEHIKPPDEKVIIVDPSQHVWGAYMPNGKMLRWGIATAGNAVCRDTGKSCRTSTGSFRIYSVGNENCISKTFPLPSGGASMPYCMYFNRGEALHGSNEVEFENISHGCVRIHVDDAKWLRYHFVESPSSRNHFQGTKVIIKPY